MPVGVLINASVVLIGGIIGTVLRKRMPNRLIDILPVVFGLSALSISIVLINQVENLAPVILAVILGTIIGELADLEHRLKEWISRLLKKIGEVDEDKKEILATVIALFCFSGTGIFGALNEGFTGNSSILIAKSIMDFFTAMIFGTTTGFVVSLIAIPQSVIGLLCYYSAGVVVPMLNAGILGDFKACGGIISLAAGLKLAKMVRVNVINMLPGLFIVMGLTYVWQRLFG